MINESFIISQVLIGIAFLFDVTSFQFKKREITLVCFFSASFLISVHFFLLGESTAGYITVLSSIRFLVCVFTTNKILQYLFILLISILGFYTFDGVEDIFSITTGILATFSAFQSNDKALRIFMMFATASMIIHNTLIWTPMGILLEAFFLTSNIISYYRFYTSRSS